MKIKKYYVCDCCGMVYLEIELCIEHEKKCLNNQILKHEKVPKT